MSDASDTPKSAPLQGRPARKPGAPGAPRAKSSRRRAREFALQALYGHGEPSLIPGITPISPLDVLDLMLIHRRAGAVILDTWTL